MVWILIVAALLVLVLTAILSPWRWPEVGGASRSDDRLVHAATELGDLEAARDAKYREIRDTEMDRETGKLSPADFAIVDAGLRAEAVELLKRLDLARARLERLQTTEASAPSRVPAANDPTTPESDAPGPAGPTAE